MVVDYSGGDSATIYATTQGTFTIPDDAAKELGLPQSGVTVTVQLTESNAVTVCGPAVFRTALNVCIPPSAVVNV